MITDIRVPYKPFEYYAAHEFRKLQQQVHWIPEEVPMSGDLQDFKHGITKGEQEIVGNILKSFAQTETVVEDYWTSKVTKWFPKPEIRAMANTFGYFETIHAEAYSLLNETLGLDDFSAFLEDEAAMAKIEALSDIDENTTDLNEIVRSVAIFSAFTEGVNLFSSFAVLMSFQLRNLFKGLGTIVEWSVRDESLHSNAGIWLVNELLKERPELRTEELRQSILDAGKLSVQLELNFIDQCFQNHVIENMTKESLINFIKYRAASKVEQLGFKTDSDELFNYNPVLLKEIEWFSRLTSGKSHTDFFAARSTDYATSDKDWSNV